MELSVKGQCMASFCSGVICFFLTWAGFLWTRDRVADMIKVWYKIICFYT